MFCCTNKRGREHIKQTPVKKQADLRQWEHSLEINDEAIHGKDLQPLQKYNTLGSSRVEQGTARSNSRGTRSMERISQEVPQFKYRKTPFINFQKQQTHQQTKYMATCQGFTLLITNLID